MTTTELVADRPELTAEASPQVIRIDEALTELVGSSREWVPEGDIPEIMADLTGVRFTQSTRLLDRLKGRNRQSRNYSKKGLIDRLLDLRGESECL